MRKIWILLLLLLQQLYGYKYMSSFRRYIAKTKKYAVVEKFDISDQIVSFLLNSPLYKPIVNTAKRTMISSAQTAGVDWNGNVTYLSSTANVDWKKEIDNVINENLNIITPDYYHRKFHGYENGNLELTSAIEQELAGRAVGARNFPNDGYYGEDRLRKSYDDSILELVGSSLPTNCTIVDFGCGTGTSTRRLASLFPQPKSIIGYDLSPHMLAVGRYLMNNNKNFNWVEKVDKDERISLCYEDIANTKLPNESVSLVSLCFVLHELPNDATISILQEAYRLLEPGGSLTILEMDPSTPGFRSLRAKPFVFSILSSTEPYLKDYFQLAPNLNKILVDVGFSVIKIKQATGRHFAIAALKPGVRDYRPSDEIRKTLDEHVSSSLRNYN